MLDLRRRQFITLLGGAAVSWPLAARAQQPGKVYRLGVLADVTPALGGLFYGLRDLGYVEGQNLIIEYRWAEGNVERLPELAAELVRLKVDIIVAPAGSAALAARNATRTIPIVTIFAGDPVELGLVTSLGRPGGNVTGTTFTPSPQLFAKQLQILKEAVPRVSRVAFLLNPADTSFAPQIKEVEVAARSLGIRLQRLETRGLEELDSAFAAMARERADALLVLAGSTFLAYRTRLAELAIKGRLPMMCSFREMVEAGGLMSYAVNMVDFIGRAAVYVDKILKGAKPADLAMEQPSSFELVINLKTAKAIGLTIPQSLLLRADELIQ